MGKRVLTIGTFDLFHVGHVELLLACRELAGDGTVIVGVNADNFAEGYKRRKPVVPEDQRQLIVSMMQGVDATFIHLGSHQTGINILEWQPDIIAVGDDWKDRDYLGQLGVSQDWLDARGIEVVYIPRTTGVSSSEIRARLGR